MGCIQNYPAPVAKTGQTQSYHDGKKDDDGALQRGVASPTPRFTVNKNSSGDEDGTVTDNLTGLIWLKDANAFGQNTWQDALDAANTLANEQHKLSDGSEAGEWRLPNVRELCSLIDYGRDNPALPEGHPFQQVQDETNDYYWSSSTYSSNPTLGWYVSLGVGYASHFIKTSFSSFYVWPVRGGQ